MGKKKIFNDPIYGIVSYPYEILYELIERPSFQRLRRISQTGMAHYVYPGAHHTRFQHALGALHLMTRALNNLKEKGVEITEAECEAACIAILLHDIGHGPYSHALEGMLVDLHHEDISLRYMSLLNEEMDNRLSLAIEIFKGDYDKPFLHELVSSQLDMDRMDYLIRDSYFTGVAEGIVGYDRLIKMLNVAEGHLVVEQKGIYSVENFLMARRLMYWQVYLHKTSLAVEQMLISIVKRAKQLVRKSVKVSMSKPLEQLFSYKNVLNNNNLINRDLIELFNKLDDIDIQYLIKSNADHPDPVLSYLCQSMLKRQLFKVSLKPLEPSAKRLKIVKNNVTDSLGLSPSIVESLVTTGYESNQLYNISSDEIRILQKSGRVVPFSQLSELRLNMETTGKFYVCHPAYE